MTVQFGWTHEKKFYLGKFALTYDLLMIICPFRYGGQLKVMFVGGPNTRKDYHIDEGEEVK